MKRGETTYIVNPNRFDLHGSLEILAKDCGEALEKHYPGWMWGINPDPEAGVIYIYALRLSGEWGYTIRIADVQNDASAKAAVMAGGEILDRYKIPRQRYHRDLLKGKMVDLRGNYIPDITDRHSKAQKEHRDRELSKALSEGKAEVHHRDTKREDGTVYRELYLKVNAQEDDDDGGLGRTG